MPEMQPVGSSNIEAIGYDDWEHRLTVKFKSGLVYSYQAVEKDTYDELMNAESKGRYFAQNIRDYYNFSKEGE